MEYSWRRSGLSARLRDLAINKQVHLGLKFHQNCGRGPLNFDEVSSKLYSSGDILSKFQGTRPQFWCVLWWYFVKISRIVSIIWMDQRLTSTILMKFHQKKWWNFIKNPRATPTILKKFHQNLWKFRYLTLGGGRHHSQLPGRHPKLIN